PRHIIGKSLDFSIRPIKDEETGMLAVIRAEPATRVAEAVRCEVPLLTHLSGTWVEVLFHPAEARGGVVPADHRTPLLEVGGLDWDALVTPTAELDVITLLVEVPDIPLTGVLIVLSKQSMDVVI